MTITRALGVMVLVAATAAAVSGQNAPAAAVAPAPAPPQSSSPDSFEYQIDGRRDPFVNVLGTGPAGQPLPRAEGVAGLTLSEISVRGVMQSRGTLIAMIQGANNRTYVIHVGDQLADGVIKSITPQGLIVLQDIHDPLSNQKQREVTKLLRSLEGSRD